MIGSPPGGAKPVEPDGEAVLSRRGPPLYLESEVHRRTVRKPAPPENFCAQRVLPRNPAIP